VLLQLPPVLLLRVKGFLSISATEHVDDVDGHGEISTHWKNHYDYTLDQLIGWPVEAKGVNGSKATLERGGRQLFEKSFIFTVTGSRRQAVAGDEDVGLALGANLRTTVATWC
jgi:hypothetical protein